uniref:Uncharacterized protein n=1 Tax=Anguilla anguilla TaxID=7936 RepID=A0A0E9SIY1_ANGAN
MATPGRYDSPQIYTGKNKSRTVDIFKHINCNHVNHFAGLQTVLDVHFPCAANTVAWIQSTLLLNFDLHL